MISPVLNIATDHTWSSCKLQIKSRKWPLFVTPLHVASLSNWHEKLYKKNLRIFKQMWRSGLTIFFVGCPINTFTALTYNSTLRNYSEDASLRVMIFCKITFLRRREGFKKKKTRRNLHRLGRDKGWFGLIWVDAGWFGLIPVDSSWNRLWRVDTG